MTVYHLNVQADVTREEMALLEKGGRNSPGWEYSVGSSSEDVIIAKLYGGSRAQLTARHIVSKSTSWVFENLDDLEDLERKLIERMRYLTTQATGRHF